MDSSRQPPLAFGRTTTATGFAPALLALLEPEFGNVPPGADSLLLVSLHKEIIRWGAEDPSRSRTANNQSGLVRGAGAM